jgi:hypothetical protein
MNVLSSSYDLESKKYEASQKIAAAKRKSVVAMGPGLEMTNNPITPTKHYKKQESNIPSRVGGGRWMLMVLVMTKESTTTMMMMMKMMA